MIASLHERAKRIRERALVLAWEYRQRDHAKGTWFRLRRTLVDAAEAWVISSEDGELLVGRGVEPSPAGLALEPRKRLFFVDPTVLATLPSRRRIAVGLNAELLGARDVALVAFPKRGATR